MNNPIREAFEKWCIQEFMDISKEDGWYTNDNTHEHWGTWQAATATTGWRTIDSAPKTDEEILISGWVYENDDWNSGYLGVHDEAPRHEKRRRYVAIGNVEDLPNGGRRGVGHRNGPVNVTHWQPLPTTPQ